MSDTRFMSAAIFWDRLYYKRYEVIEYEIFISNKGRKIIKPKQISQLAFLKMFKRGADIKNTREGKLPDGLWPRDYEISSDMVLVYAEGIFKGEVAYRFKYKGYYKERC